MAPKYGDLVISKKQDVFSPVSAFSFQGHVRAGKVLYHIPLLLAGCTGNVPERGGHTEIGELLNRHLEDKAVELPL